MTDRPIIFSAPMVRALINQRKSETRRLASSPLRLCIPRDRLWVREACKAAIEPDTGRKGVQYAADDMGKLMALAPYQLKFVVDTPNDLAEIDTLLTELAGFDPERVLLMPQGTSAEELERRSPWVREHCHQHGFTYCPRKQIEWFGSVRGT